MPKTIDHDTGVTLSTKRIRSGHYAVRADVPGGGPDYTITRNPHGTWDLRMDGTMAAYGCRTVRVALHEAAARYCHDARWAEYVLALAEHESSNCTGIGRMFAPKPDTRAVSVGEAPLAWTAKIVACRIGHDSLMPGYEVFLDDVSLGFLCMYNGRWHVEGTSRWYCHDWVNMRHGSGTKTPEAMAKQLMAYSIRYTTRRYMGTEIARRDAAADEVEQRLQRRS